MEEIAVEIDAILRQRARTLRSLGYEAEWAAMGPHPRAAWRGGPKIVVFIGHDQGREVRYMLKREKAEKYLKRIRKAPSACLDIDEKHREES